VAENRRGLGDITVTVNKRNALVGLSGYKEESRVIYSKKKQLIIKEKRKMIMSGEKQEFQGGKTPSRTQDRGEKSRGT